MEKKFLSACSMVNQDKQKEFEQELLRFRKSAEQCWDNRNKVLPRIMENFEAYKDKYRITILAPIMLPPDYYHGFVERNPITGALVLAGVEKQFDFWFVDLFDRDFCCDNPENLEKDPFLFKATILPMRTWMMQMLVQQLEAARQGYSSVLAVTFSDDKVVHSTVRDDCAAIALSQAVQLGHNYNSPFQALMYITFVCAFSKSLGLIIYTCMMSCFSLWVAQAFSVPVLFRFTRVVDLLLRSIYLILLFTAVAEVGLSSLGDALGILAILAVFCMMIFDMLRGDLGTFMTYSTETKYDILKQLGDRAWICQLVPARQKRDGKNGGTGRNGSQSSMMSKTMKAGMSFLESDAGDRPLPNLITGELPSDVTEEQALLVVDVNGMLCQLTPVDARTVDYVENVRRSIEGRPEKHSDISMYKRTYRRNPAAFAVVDDRPPLDELDATAAIQRHMEEAKMKRSQTKEMSHDGEHHAGPPTASPSSSSAASSAQKRAIEELDFEFSGPDDDHISSPSSSSKPKATPTPVSKFSLEPHVAEEAEGTGPSSTFTAPQAMTRAMPSSSSSSSAEVHAAEIGGSSSSSSSRKILPEDPGEDSYSSEESEDYDDNDVDSGAEVGDEFVAAENKLFEGTHQAASPASAKKGGKPKRAAGAVPKRKKKGVYGDGTLPDVTLCGLLHEIQAEEDAAPVSNSLKSLDDGTSMWRVAAKKRKMATLAPPYEPMMVSIVNMPIYNRNYPSQVHKETLFRLQSKARKSAEPPAE
mmetsp:Transcript_18514/g.46201  ORF Transcript_18514/g.46201 Transcript_18514/m.46201 type:complete len:756 (-) Transcript_18514:870-3137(-)|eukprot:CAMPEP_0178982442 /NCGR_PEP_ID=MMETSP0795-20121207/499_1 /TAXON_ID=88552 /ORGANISM="Amoebophrya sp., Strain Ameob2" /LENGTH=755 /DNA_ID=CAMNT_0020673089 /DNA_START=470 /DNA_END=2737 /DNA_ORIENTATION=+